MRLYAVVKKSLFQFSICWKKCELLRTKIGAERIGTAEPLILLPLLSQIVDYTCWLSTKMFLRVCLSLIMLWFLPVWFCPWDREFTHFIRVIPSSLTKHIQMKKLIFLSDTLSKTAVIPTSSPRFENATTLTTFCRGDALTDPTTY